MKNKASHTQTLQNILDLKIFLSQMFFSINFNIFIFINCYNNTWFVCSARAYVAPKSRVVYLPRCYIEEGMASIVIDAGVVVHIYLPIITRIITLLANI